MKPEKEKEILFENIETISTICCSACGKTNSLHTDDYYASDEFYAEGWRATINKNIYCPNCAKRKLKSRNE